MDTKRLGLLAVAVAVSALAAACGGKSVCEESTEVYCERGWTCLGSDIPGSTGLQDMYGTSEADCNERWAPTDCEAETYCDDAGGGTYSESTHEDCVDEMAQMSCADVEAGAWPTSCDAICQP